MNILFDYQAFDLQTHGGISRSFVQLYRNLHKDVNATIALKESDNVYANELGVKPNGYFMHNFISSYNYPLKNYLFRAYNRLFRLGYGMDYNKKYSVQLLKKGNFDVFHPTYFDAYFVDYLNGKPFVLTVHDMTPEMNPKYFEPDYYEIVKKRNLIHKANAIVAVSENTKNDILKIYPEISPEKIQVVYHGPSFPEGIQPSLHATINTKYLLFVGHRWRYKNFELFVKHISPFLNRHKDVNVICTGDSFYPFELDLFAHYGLSGRFTSTFVKTDQEFIDLYHKALAFVYPSSYEGFGMPILEAFQGQTVCMLNCTSCFPEIGGDAPLYFTLTEKESNLSDVAESVYQMSESERKDIINRQLERLNYFSWEQSAKKLYEVYKSLI